MTRKKAKAPAKAGPKTTRRARAVTTTAAPPERPIRGARRDERPDKREGDERPGKRETGKRKRTAPDASAPLVLVVDDFKDGRDIVVETLEFSGLRAAEAADGHEALAKCKALRPNLVLMDLSLPGMDGWEVTRQLKKDPATRGIKVIALTAHAQVDALDRARQAGADGVITKPCLPTHVVEQVREMLGAAAPEGA